MQTFANVRCYLEFCEMLYNASSHRNWCLNGTGLSINGSHLAKMKKKAKQNKTKQNIFVNIEIWGDFLKNDIL